MFILPDWNLYKWYRPNGLVRFSPYYSFRPSVYFACSSSCSPGQYSGSTGSFICLECPLGTYGAGSSLSSCLGCPPGSQQNQASQSTCQLCAPGYFSTSSGQVGKKQIVCFSWIQKISRCLVWGVLRVPSITEAALHLANFARVRILLGSHFFPFTFRWFSWLNCTRCCHALL